MKIDNLLMWDLEEGVTRIWSLEEVLAEINRDRSDSWTDYTEEDWRDGWDEWCEGQFYKLLDIRYKEEQQGGKK